MIFIYAQLIKIFTSVHDSILLQRFLHIKVHAIKFPRVAACVTVVVDVTILYLRQDFFGADLKWVLSKLNQTGDMMLPRLIVYE